MSDTQRATIPDLVENQTDVWLIFGLVVAIGIGVMLRLYGVEDMDFLGEELDYFQLARQDPARHGLFSGYYWLLWLLFQSFGETLLVARLPTLLVALVTLWVFYREVKITLGPNVAVFALVFLAFSHWHVEQSQMATPSAWLFLLGTVFFTAVLKLIHGQDHGAFKVALISGVLAVLCQYSAALMFLPVLIYGLLSFMWDELLPEPAARGPLMRLMGALALLTLLLSPLALGDLAQWLDKPDWGTQGWALIPLLAVNLLSIPIFLAGLLGLICLFQRPGQFPAFLLLTLSIATILLTLGLMGMVMNLAHHTLFSLMPLFFMAVGAFCATIYERFQADSPLIGLAPCALLLAATLPQLLSFYLEKENLSSAELLQEIVRRAEAEDRLTGNLWHPLVDFASLVYLDDPAPPYDASFNWEAFLNAEFATAANPVWFAFDVPRTGMAPALKRWLVAHTVLVEEESAGRLDRRERVLSVWYKP